MKPLDEQKQKEASKRRIEKYARGKYIVSLDSYNLTLYTLDNIFFWKSTTLLEHWRACIAVEETIYLFCTSTNGSAVAAGKFTYKGHLLMLSLSPKANMKLPKIVMQVCSINTGYLFVVGTSGKNKKMACEKYNIRADKWQTAPYINTRNDCFTLFCFQCQYIFCTYHDGQFTSVYFLNTLDEEENSWGMLKIKAESTPYNFLYQSFLDQIIFWDMYSNNAIIYSGRDGKFTEKSKKNNYSWDRYSWPIVKNVQHNVSTTPNHNVLEQLYGSLKRK